MTKQASLLLVIDLQNGWRHPSATETAMLKTVDLCKQFTGDKIHCCFKNEPTSLFYRQLNWSRFSQPPDTAEIPEIAPLKLPKYWRNTYSCLTDEILTKLQAYGEVYLAGVFTDISVAATAMDIFDHCKPVSVLSDCVATLHGEPVHQAALRSLEHAIGRDHVITAQEFLNRQR